MAGTLWVLMGLPASGKSTLAASLGGEVITFDAMRDGASPAAVTTVARRRAEALLRRGDDVIVDACNVLPQHRASWLAIARKVGAVARLVVVDLEVDECHARNAARSNPVPREVIDRYSRAWPTAVEAVTREGWIVSEPRREVASRRW